MKFTRSLGLASLVLAGVVGPAQLTPAAETDCDAIHRVVTRAVNPAKATSSTSFVAVPDTSFTAPDTHVCLVVHYSALVDAPGGMRLRLLVDGAATGVQPQFIDFRPGAARSNRTGIFVKRISGGDHTVAFEFMSLDGTEVSVARQIVIVNAQGGD